MYTHPPQTESKQSEGTLSPTEALFPDLECREQVNAGGPLLLLFFARDV